jgi:hypothetical protein
MRIEAEIRKIVREAASRRDPGFLIDELTRLFKNSSIDFEFQQNLISEAKKNYDWLASRTIGADERRTANELFRRAGADFAKIKGDINRDLLSRVSDAIKQDKSFREINNIAESIMGRFAYRARTITETSLSGFDTAATIIEAEKAGIDEFKYYGPPAERPFCIRLLSESAAGRTWTKEQIQDMDNGQGLPVLYYRGGYNCKHTWVMVTEGSSEARTGKIIETIKESPLKYNKKDLKQDTRKHASKFGLNDDEYVKEAQKVVKGAKETYKQIYKNKIQYVFVGERGYVTTNPDGTIKGYFHSKDIKLTINKLKEKKPWGKI